MKRLGYYTPRFPFPQGSSAGPYSQFVGRRPRVPCVLIVPRKPAACPCKKRRRRRGLAGLGDDTAGLPAGSQLVYNATWTQGVLLQDYTAVAAQLKPQLASQGIIIDSDTGKAWYQSGYGITLNIHTSIDFSQAADVKSIIDHWIYVNNAGQMPQSAISTASLAAPIPNSVASTTPANPSAAAADLANYNAALAAGDATSAATWLAQYQLDSGITTPSSSITWLENNAAYVAGGLLALVLLWKIA